MEVRPSRSACGPDEYNKLAVRKALQLADSLYKSAHVEVEAYKAKLREAVEELSRSRTEQEELGIRFVITVCRREIVELVKIKNAELDQHIEEIMANNYDVVSSLKFKKPDFQEEFGLGNLLLDDSD